MGQMATLPIQTSRETTRPGRSTRVADAGSLSEINPLARDPGFAEMINKHIAWWSKIDPSQANGVNSEAPPTKKISLIIYVMYICTC